MCKCESVERQELIRRLEERDSFWKENARDLLEEIKGVQDEMYKDEYDKFPDVSITLTETNTTLIGRQIVLYVDKQTFEDIIRKRKGTLEDTNGERQFYMDIASICFVSQ
ncbi:MAG: hypothetical protein ACTSYJ_08170 [Candidatus Thorarchaeota archaeon]